MNAYTVKRCPACLDSELAEFHEIPPYFLEQCLQCGFVFVKNVPSEHELNEFYKQGYEDEGSFSPKSNIGRKAKYYLFSKYIKRLCREQDKIRLLEIGCGQGDLLSAVAGDDAFEAQGIDLARGPIDYAQSIGLRAQKKSLEEMSFPGGRFDFIVMLHVFEHVHSPEKTINEILRILKPGGYFFAVVPCISHIKAKWAGVKWKYIGPPGHLWYFTTGAFRLFLERHGFEVLKASCFYHRAHVRILARKPLSSR